MCGGGGGGAVGCGGGGGGGAAGCCGGEAAAQPGVVAEEAGAGLAAAGAPVAQDVPEGERPSGAGGSWAFRQDPTFFWATTIGAYCACDGMLISCMAVSVVVASSAILRCVMCFGSRGKF